MEPTSLILLVALSVIVAIFYQKINAVVMKSAWGVKIYGNGSFTRATAVIAFVIFVSLIAASIILGAVDKTPKLPTV